MFDQVLKETSHKMDQSVDTVKKELTGVRTGRASLSMVDGIHVSAYGSEMPLNQVATLAVPEPALITVKPFDVSLLGAIEKAINKASIGITPANDTWPSSATNPRRQPIRPLAHPAAVAAS